MNPVRSEEGKEGGPDLRPKSVLKKWLEGKAVKSVDFVFNHFASYLFGVLTVVMGAELLQTPLKYQDPFVTAEINGRTPPISASLSPFLAEIRRQANDTGIALSTPFGSSLSLAYCSAFRPGNVDVIEALFKFESQFAGCVSVARISSKSLTRLEIQPGPAFSTVSHFRPDDGSVGKIGFCGCTDEQKSSYLVRNERLFKPSR